METPKFKTPLQVAVQQITNNTTAWIGHRTTDNADVVAGQTFICPSEGDLDAIEIFSSLVMQPGHVNMSLHAFEADTKEWGPALSTASVSVDKVDNNKWIAFPLNGLHLHKGSTYGFRLQSNDLYLGIGEAAGSHSHPPYTDGQEWVLNTENKNGKYFSYLSLAFKVDLRA